MPRLLMEPVNWVKFGATILNKSVSGSLPFSVPRPILGTLFKILEPYISPSFLINLGNVVATIFLVSPTYNVHISFFFIIVIIIILKLEYLVLFQKNIKMYQWKILRWLTFKQKQNYFCTN